MGFLKPPKVNLPPAEQAPPVPPVVMQPDTRPKKKPMAPTFLGAEATPGATQSTGGGKTLLGQ